jgi:mono/diheme cytochrome c family protein
MQKIIFIKISVVILLSSVIQSCYFDKYAEIHPLSTYEDICDSAHAATYQQSVIVVMNNSCVSCHTQKGASGGISLDTYESVLAQAQNGKLMGSINHQSSYIAMPPGTKIRDCEIAKLQLWVNNGMPR